MTIRNAYAHMGVDTYYQQCANDYQNPHELIVAQLIQYAKKEHWIGEHVLDLCCGSGEVTRLLQEKEVVGSDPYMQGVYEACTGKTAYDWSFTDIASGKMTIQFDTIICSFALHLCPTSMLPTVLWQLGQCANQLIVLSPNKKPDCHGVSGWKLTEEVIIERVRMRHYQQNNH